MMVLEVSGLHAYYGKSHILQGVDLRVGQGEIVSIVGRNGVGRSTTLMAIMGAVACHGSILFLGRSLMGLPPHEVARRGIGVVPESREIFDDLTVEQNLVLGIRASKTAPRWTMDDTFDAFPVLHTRRRTLAGVLSGGEKQMLAICRTLMGNPSLILVDEPAEGLSPAMVEHVANLLRRVNDRGISILLVEQKLEIAAHISHRMYVMGRGRTVFEGTPSQLAAADEVRRRWLAV